MRLPVLTLLLLLPLWIGFSSFSFSSNDPETIYLEHSKSRNLVFMEEMEQEFELCNLEIGKKYRVFSGGAEGFKVMITDAGSTDPKGTMIEFKATSSCKVVRLYQTVFVPKAAAYISVDCVECPSDNPVFNALKGGPITGSSGTSAQFMVENVFIGGGCFDVSGISYTGNPQSRGLFNGGLSSIGIDNGIVLSSGNVGLISGPNNQTGAGQGMGTNGDFDLGIVGGSGIQTFDAAILEFEFEPTVPQIQFEYVFASEEYCDYANSLFNDVFGFFLSGPGLNGPYTNNAVNIALLPNGTNVSINNVNHVNNPAFYVGNIPPGDFQLTDPQCNGHPTTNGISVQHCQFDGYTVVLTAVANVIPCETYRIKLAIGDGTDDIFDSAVFLGANSFEAGGTGEVAAFVPATGTPLTYEGCGQAFFTFTRNGGDLTQPLVINFSIGGTATPGVDYGTLPTSVVIPPGQTIFQLPVNVFSDNITEGQETIILVLDDPCICDAATAELIIQDIPELNVSIEDQSVCQGLPVTIMPTITGGVPPLSYQWSNGSPAPVYVGQPQTSQTVTLTVTDQCGQVVTAEADIDVFVLEATISGAVDYCPGGDDAFLQVDFTGEGPWNLTYTIDGMGPFTINGITDNPYDLQVTEGGTYEVLVVVEGGCIGSGLGEGIVSQPDINFDSQTSDLLCFEDANASINLTVDGGNAPYTYDWSNGDTVEDPANLPAGSYTVVVTDDNGCESDTTIVIDEPAELVATILSTVGVDCDNPTGGSIDLDVSGGISDYSYNWSNGDTIQDPTGLSAGQYSVVITDMNGCTVNASANVPGDINIPLADILVDGVINCSNTLISLDGSNSSAGPNITYDWIATGGGNIVGPSDQQSVDVDAPGTYELTVTNTDNGCFSTSSVIVQPDQDQPTAIADAPGLDCVTDEVTISSNGSSIGPNIEYDWSTLDGNIVSATDIANPTVDAPGTYTLIVLDTDNGCTDTVMVDVLEDLQEPSADAGLDAEVDCITTTVVLDGSGSSTGANFEYEWSTTDGNIVGDINAVDPEVDQPGTYILTVTNTLNGCVSADEVEVLDISVAPQVDIAVPDLITCAVDSVLVDGSGSDTGADFEYDWDVVSGGNILSGSDSPIITVDAPGIYELTVNNTSNGCSSTLEVEVLEDTASPVAEAGDPFFISCLNPTVQLDGTGSSSGPNISYQWIVIGGGNIVSGEDSATPTINEPGTYELTVINNDNGCAASDIVDIEGDGETPVAAALNPGTLNCQDTSLLINGSGSSIGANFSYLWITNDGNITNGQNSLFINVNAGGTYTLEVTNENNGCVATTNVVVDIDTLNPLADAGLPLTLTCADPILDIDGSGSSTGNEFLYEWETVDGNIIGPLDSVQTTVDLPGTYLLTVTNTNNNCVSTSEVVVDEDVTPPIAEAVVDAELNCTVTSLDLDGSGSSSGPSISYDWSTTNGNIVSGADTDSPVVDAPGTYQLTVVNEDNGCSEITDVLVSEDVAIPTAAILNPDLLTCAITEITLDGNASSSGPEFSYDWNTPDGSISGNADQSSTQVDAPGTYVLIVTDDDNTCTDTATVLVDQDIVDPIAEAGPTFELDCGATSVSLDGNGSSTGPEFEYNWSTVGGNILAGANTLSPQINAAGTYTLSVVNTQNGCETIDDVLVELDDDAPVADAGVAPDLTCAVQEISLDGSGSTQGANITYEWTVSGPDGNIVNGQNTLNPMVDEPGTYVLTVTDLSNDCQTISTVVVNENVEAPDVVATAGQTITCDDPVVTLDGSGSSSGANFSYQWTTVDGNILGGATTLNPQVDATGTYILEVTDLTNGCVSSMSAVVADDLAEPALDILPPSVLTCSQTTIEIDATNSSTGFDFIYAWTTPDGQIISGAASPNPVVGEPGTYNLLITNTTNGCTSTGTVTVDENVEDPLAEAGTAVELNCDLTSLSLDGSGSDQGAEFSYSWSTANGNIVNGATTLNPEINAPGTYTLTVTNTINDCVSTDVVTVGSNTTPPNVFVANPGLLTCIAEEVTLNASGSDSGPDYQLSWSTISGIIIDDSNPLAPVVGESGQYTLTIVNTENGCEQSQTVTVLEDITLPGADAGDPVTLNCNLPSVNLEGSASNSSSVSYLWSTTDGNIVGGATTASPLIDAPGTYSLTITDNVNGCESTDEVDIVENNPEEFEWEIQAPVCNTNSGIIQFTGVSGGTPPYEYSIDGGANFSSQAFYGALESGLYDIVIQDANGCTLMDEALLPQSEDALVEVETSVKVDLGDTYQIVALTNVPDDEIEEIIWEPSEGLSCTDCLDPFVTPLNNITYTVTIRTVEGCLSTDVITLRVNRQPKVYIPSGFSPNGDGDNDVFMIFAGEQVANIKSFYVFSRWGEPVYSLFNFQPNDPNNGWRGDYRGQPMNPGVFAYFAEIEFIDGRVELFEGSVTLVR
jgi:gliding motility-associated-like protein